MRVIKFKAWDRNTKKMCQVWSIFYYDDKILVDIYGLGNREETALELGKECELIQYVNYHDKNEKEIYEGNILKDNYGNVFVMTMRLSLDEQLVEVIGDIHKNPELLK